jgi:Mor family transcriptional regulator
LDNLTIDDLEPPYDELANEVGLEVAKQIAKLYQGQQIYFPKLERKCDPLLKKTIKEEFDGYNFKELAVKYDYSERWIRKIVEDQVAKERGKPLENNVSFAELFPEAM